MICSNHNSEVIRHWYEQDKHLMLRHKEYVTWWHTSAEMTTYLCMVMVSGEGLCSEPISLVTIPGRRASLFVRTDGSLSYSPHVFARYCERILGYEVDPDTNRCKVSVEESAARFMLDTRDLPYAFIGNTAEEGRAIAVLGDHLLLIKTNTDNGIPMVETFVSSDMVQTNAYETACVNFAKMGRMKDALQMYNAGKQKSQVQ